MDDNFDVEMFDFVKRMLENDPDNKYWQEQLTLIIQKKSEYDLEKLKYAKERDSEKLRFEKEIVINRQNNDLEKLRFEKEIIINQQNNNFNYYMQDAVLKQQCYLINNGFPATAVPDNRDTKLIEIQNI
jgi:hypothetical protein